MSHSVVEIFYQNGPFCILNVIIRGRLNVKLYQSTPASPFNFFYSNQLGWGHGPCAPLAMPVTVV